MSRTVPRVLVPIADGSEDMETASITDVFVRCGIEVVTVSCNPNPTHDNIVTFARGMKTIPNAGHISTFAEKHASTFLQEFDAIAYPGGMPGSGILGQSAPLTHFAKQLMNHNGKIVAAICAAPAVALGANGLLEHVAHVTCFPMMKDKITQEGTQWRDERVVVDKNSKSGATVITSQGPGTALLFALQISAHIVGEETAAKVAAGMLVGEHKFVHTPKL